MMQLTRFDTIVSRAQGHHRLEQDSHEFPGPVAVLAHEPGCSIAIIDHAYVVNRTQVQIPEHVARRKARDQQFFRVVARGIAAKVWIARSGNFGLVITHNDVIAPVGFVCPGALPVVSGPLYPNFVGVLFHGVIVWAVSIRDPCNSAGRNLIAGCCWNAPMESAA